MKLISRIKCQIMKLVVGATSRYPELVVTANNIKDIMSDYYGAGGDCNKHIYGAGGDRSEYQGFNANEKGVIMEASRIQRDYG